MIRVKKEVIKKILEEERKYPTDEYGGWVIVKGNIVVDVVFDVQSSTYGHVQFGAQSLMKLPKAKRRHVRGWFHKHPIVGLSSLDIHTIMNLTNFWGDCVSMVLQSNRDLMVLKTKLTKEFVTGRVLYTSDEHEEILVGERDERY